RDALGEVLLKIHAVLDPFLLHERLDLLVLGPVLAVALVSADVHERVGKQRGHLAEKLVDELVDGFACRIKRRIHDSPGPLDLVWTRLTGKRRIADKPACRVTGHVELGHYSYSAIGGVGNDLSNLILRVVEPVRAQLVKFWKPPAFNSEPLIF